MNKRMFQVLSVGAPVLGGVLMLSSTTSASPANGRIVPGQYVVITEAGVDPSDVVAEHGLAARHIYRAAVNGFAGAVPGNKLADLRADPRVLLI